MQRVAIGRALVRRPKALLMDEPIGALDAKLREDMRAELKRLHIENGSTTVYVTHDQVEAMSLADRIAVMNDGVLQQVGTPVGGLPAPRQPLRRAVRRQPGDERRRRPRSRDRRRATTRRARRRRPRASPSRASCRRGSPRRCRPGTSSSLGVRPEGVLRRARGRRPGYVPVEAHIIEPLGAYDIVDLKVGEQLLRARTPSGFVAPARRHGLGRARRRRRRISSTRPPATSLRARAGLTWLHIRLAERHQDASARHAALRRPDLDDRRRRVLRPARPDRRRQDHDAAADRRARDARRRHASASAARTSPTGARPSATWRWSSSNTRSTRATRCAQNLDFPLKSTVAQLLRADEIERAGRARRQDAAHRASARAQDRPALRRRDAARLDRPRHRAQAARLPDGRAALQPRRQAARGAARRAQGPADRSSAPPSCSSPTTRSRRCRWATSIGVLNEGRLVQVGTPQRDLQRAARHLRRELRRLAGDEPARRPRSTTAG